MPTTFSDLGLEQRLSQTRKPLIDPTQIVGTEPLQNIDPSAFEESAKRVAQIDFEKQHEGEPIPLETPIPQGEAPAKLGPDSPYWDSAGRYHDPQAAKPVEDENEVKFSPEQQAQLQSKGEVDATPEQQAQMAKLNAPPELTPEQHKTLQETGEVTLDARQQKQMRKVTGELDPLQDFSPAQLAELEISTATGDPKNAFSISRTYMARPDLIGNPEVIRKIADAVNLVAQRDEYLTPGSVAATARNLHPIKAVKEFAVGLGKYLVNAVEGAASPFVPEETRNEYRRKAAENLAASELALTGLAQGTATAGKKIVKTGLTAAGFPEIIKPLSEYNAQEKQDYLFSILQKQANQEQISKGRGAVTQTVGGEVIKDLESKGLPVRPEQVSELAAGDPFNLYAFGKAFGVAGGAIPAAAKVALGETAVPAFGEAISAGTKAAAGASLQALGATARAGLKLTEKVAPTVGAIEGLLKAGPFGVLGGAKAGEIIAKGARKVIPFAEGVAETGRQVRGLEPVKTGLQGDIAQSLIDIAEGAPNVAGHVAGGLALDLGTAAAMAELPEEEQAPGIGAVFGLAGGAHSMLRQTVGGQLIAPRGPGSSFRGRVAAAPGLPADFNAAHNAAYTAATPAEQQWLNATRQFLRGSAPNADLFYIPDEAQRAELFQRNFGATPEQAAHWAQQKGGKFDLPGGKSAIIVADAAAAPHEVFHPFQDVIGDKANRLLDKAVQDAYTPEEFENEAKRYASRLGWDGEGDWRDYVVSVSGWGYAEAVNKITQQVDAVMRSGGAEPTKAEVNTEVNRLLSEMTGNIIQSNPGIDAAELNRNIWRGILTPEEQKSLGDRYASRELSAETWDAVFKHRGGAPSKVPPGLINKFARVAGRVMNFLGEDPLAGRTSEIGQIPLRQTLADAVIRAVDQSKEGTTPATTPATTPIPAPTGTPIQRADAAREIAARTPDVPIVPGGQSQREAITNVADALETGGGVKITRASAPDEPAASMTSNRDVRRDIIEAWRGVPASEKPKYEKNFFPDQVRDTKSSGLQIGGWAPEVWASNAHKTAEALAELQSRGVDTSKYTDRYPIDPATKSFTEAGWQQLYDDLQIFVRNQQHGFAGSGEQLVVPKGTAARGFFKPAEIGNAEGGLTQDAADVINSFFGFRPPSGKKGAPEQVIVRGKPLTLAGAEISEATLPGRTAQLERGGKPVVFVGETAAKQGIAGEPVREVNPFRTWLADNGANPSTIEAFQWLNASDIMRAEHAGELTPFRGNTLTLKAGFQPQPKNPRAVSMAAVRDEDTGEIFTGSIHAEAAVKARPGLYDEGFTMRAPHGLTDGFVTNSGEFLTREEAFNRAIELKQLPADSETAQTRTTLESDLFAAERAFQPRDVEVTGPDDKKYKARFDGHQDMTVLGLGHVPQLTALEDIPGVAVAGSTTYAPSLESKGYKIPADIKSEFQPPAEEKQAPRVGLEFKKFFSDVTKGTFGKSAKPFEPIVDLSEAKDVVAARAKHSGNFDDHIAKSIPTFYETQVKKAKAIADTYGDSGAKVLDIAASEGSFGKSISDLTGGKVETVSLDPNPDMAAFFESKSKVPGATYSQDSFLNGFEDAGVNHPAHNPAEPYDVINESMGFQFIDPDRGPQIAEVKRLLKPDGVFLTEEKVRNADWAANEAKKDSEYKAKYFSGDELKAKDNRVGFAQAKDEAKSVGMVDNMANQEAFEKTLSDNFDYVVQYWDSGNFKGYAAGDDATKVNAIVKSMGDKSSDFSTVDLPREVSFQPNAEIQKVRDDYQKDEGITPPARPITKKFNEDVAKQIADYYDAQPKNVTTPEARKSYDAFNQETKRQYQKLVDAGYVLEPWRGEGAPYANSAELHKDLAENKHLSYLPSATAIGEGPAPKDIADYPPLEPSGVRINGEEVPYNDLFRAVHDTFGHGTNGRTFSADGEFQAWQDHSQMYSDEAQPALALETLGQNAWFNAGKHLRRADGSLPKKGDADFIPLHDRNYAPRTIFRFPEDLMEKAREAGKPELPMEARGAQFQPSEEKPEVFSFDKLYHVSTADRLPSIAKQGLQIKGRKPSIGVKGTPYEKYSKGRVFATDGDGIGYWVDTTSKFVEYNFDNYAEDGIAPVVLRISNPKGVEYDGIGSHDAGAPAYFSSEPIAPNRLDVWDGEKWVPVSEHKTLDLSQAFDESGHLNAGSKLGDPPSELAKEFQPAKKRKPSDDLKFLGTQFNEPSKAWILPSGKVEQLGAQWHHDWLDQNPEVQKKYGLKVPPFEGGDTEGVREAAIKKGFSRVNLANGSLTVELREKDWKNIRPVVEDLVERNLDDVDKIRVQLLDDSATKLNRTLSGNIFDADTDAQKSAAAMNILQGEPPAGAAQFQPSENPKAISQAAVRDEETGKIYTGTNHPEIYADQIAPEFSGPEDVNFSRFTDGFVTKEKEFLNRDEAYNRAVSLRQVDKKELDAGNVKWLETRSFAEARNFQPPAEQELLFGGTEKPKLSTRTLGEMTREELQTHYPEAVVPRKRDEILNSEITSSPLYKKSDEPAQAFADKLVEFAKQYEDNPAYKAGLKWYSEFTPLLKKHFGSDAPIMAELLAATSPQTDPSQNFAYALDALDRLKSGKYDRIVKKFNQGMEMVANENWLGWYNKELKAGKVPDAPETPTPATFLAHWIKTHDLTPTQSNGKLFGHNSKAVLQVLGRKWLTEARGPKTLNFVENLLGISHDATIDLWADRTMRRIGYDDGSGKRWRILPKNQGGVSDEDFAFAQDAFREAAKRLKLKPSALQGGLWFAEKALWSERGWGNLDLGDFRTEIAKISELRKRNIQREKPPEAEQTGLQFQPMKINEKAFKVGPLGRTDTVVYAEDGEKAVLKYAKENGIPRTGVQGGIQFKNLTVRGPYDAVADELKLRPRKER